MIGDGWTIRCCMDCEWFVAQTPALEQEVRELRAEPLPVVSSSPDLHTSPEMGQMLADAATAARAGDPAPGEAFSRALREHFKRKT